MEEKKLRKVYLMVEFGKPFAVKGDVCSPHGRTNFFAVLQVHVRIQERRGIGYENACQGLLHRR